MKKKLITSLILVFTMICLLTGCKSKEAKNVETLIKGIGTVTEKSEKLILAAEEAYDALSAEDQASIGNKETLVAARVAFDSMMRIQETIDAIDSLKENAEAAMADDSDMILTEKQIDAKISSWMKKIEAMETARENYDAMSAEDKEKVTNYSTLTKKEESLIKEFNNIAGKLGEVFLPDVDKYEEEKILLESGKNCDLRTIEVSLSWALYGVKFYDSLPEGYQSQITAMTDINTFVDNYSSLIQSKLDAVLNTEISLDSEKDIAEAEMAMEICPERLLADYSQMSRDLAKAKEAYSELVAAEAARIEAMNAGAVVDLIAAIGDVTLDKEEQITNAQNAFSALTTNEKNMVSNYSVLKDAQSAIKVLKKEAENAAKVAEAKSLIRISDVHCSSPDYVGGVSVYLAFTNLSSKTIKYLNFTITLYNAVGDRASCEIQGYSSYSCYCTGPFGYGQGYSYGSHYWGPYYNYDIKYATLSNVSIEYMDGSYYSLTKEQLEAVQY